MKKKKTMQKAVILIGVFIFIIALFMNFTSANLDCSELKKSDCKQNSKCVFESNGIFKKGSCIDAKNYYSEKIEQNKLKFLNEGSEKKDITGFFTKIYWKITGKAPVELQEAYMGEEADLGNYRKETFYINAGSKLLAKIVK